MYVDMYNKLNPSYGVNFEQLQDNWEKYANKREQNKKDKAISKLNTLNENLVF